MAIRNLDRSFGPNTKEISYLSKTFPQWRDNLMNFAKVYFPNTHSDFNESSPGMMFIEMASYVGDVLSYYIDTQFRENLMQYAEEQDNIIAMAQALGYKPKPGTASATDADFYQLCPATTVASQFVPDTRFMMRLATNTVVTAPQYGTSFRTTAEVNFADSNDREITVYSVNGSNQPSMYLLRKRVRVVSGEIKSYDTSFGAPQRFAVVQIPDTSVLEVLSVKDSNGFTWYEVDYLAQDLIIDARDNTNPTLTTGQSISPSYVMRVTRTPRRFVTRYDSDYNLELHFGSGILDDSSSLVNLQPNKIASSEYQQNLASTSLDPSDFLSSQSYGLSPGNISMTIRYVSGGGLDSNVPSNSINKIDTVQVINDKSGFTPTELALFNDVVASLAVNNAFPATGGKGTDAVEEIRQNALAFFNSQNRTVNAEDYTVRCYAMPAKFGGAAKVFVAQDDQLNAIMLNQTTPDGTFVNNVGRPNVVNLYVLGYDQKKNLVTLNDDVKKNLRTYIDQYRILTDEVRILDAFVVNIGVEFEIVVFKNYNMNEVLLRCIDAITSFFNIDSWQLNQPIILADLYSTIAGVDGVQSVKRVDITNKYRHKDGSDYNDYLYDITGATDFGVVYPSLDPCIFELRYPENDIVGSASQ